jgi:serine/threonine protein kinase/tetratricopeptide (TPR) repeat protein
MANVNAPTPAHLADFEIVRRLGSGGMAEVFLAKKRGAEQTFKLQVVKRILPAHGASPRFRAMFAVEAQLATRLNHPNIVQVYDFQDYAEGGLLLSMEYVEGPDLRKVHRAARARNTRLSPYVAAYIVSEVAKGLHYAHERTDEGGHPLNIVHRDVSPQNILLSYDGSVKVADFGIATATLFRQEAGVLKGKAAYMSPEQARGDDVDRRSDIYSLGIVFHELLTGRWLHDAADDKDVLEAVRTGAVEPPSLFVRGVPPELESIVMRALQVERDNRFPTARDLATAITRVLFQKQQLIDAQTLEGVILDFCPREPDVIAEREEEEAKERRGRSSDVASSVSLEPRSTTGSAVGTLRTRYPGTRTGREVRHVSLVHLRIHGRSELEAAIGRGATSRIVDRTRQVLSNIAYRAGTRWVWDDEQTDRNQTAIMMGSAYAVVGVMPNPSGAANSAAMLALDVHDALAAACEELPCSLRASISIVRGVAEGKRDRGGHLIDYRIHNPARTISEKLVDATPGGVTSVAGGVFRLVRRDFVWQDAPSLSLAEPQVRAPLNMRVYQLMRPLSREEKHAQGSTAHRDLVGRDAELAELHAAYHQCVTAAESGSSGQVVARLVSGELGIGKTALVTAFLNELPPHARELRAECSPYRTELPFSNAAQWLRTLTGIKPEEPIEQARAAIIDVLGDLSHEPQADEVIKRMSELATGQFAEATDEADAARHRRLLATGIRHFFARAAQRAPLVLLVDGLQWIDQPSMELLSSLIRRSDTLGFPLLIVLVSRPEERLLAFVEGMVRVELGALSHADQLRLVEAHVGTRQGVGEACADLFPRAAGNPFFLLEMVDSLLERGSLELNPDSRGGTTLVRRVERQEEGLALPSTLEQLIADRLNELPPEDKLVIDWLAVSGGPLQVSELSALVGDVIQGQLQRLIARGLCTRDHDTIDVKHPLTRDVSYAALSNVDRAAMHQQIGERLAQGVQAKGLNAAIVARHLALGDAKESAAPYYLEAASAARVAYQLPLAARYYRRALDTLPFDDQRRIKTYLSLEEIYRVQGKWNERTRYLSALREQALKSNNGFWVASALLRTARFDYDAGHLNRALGVARLAESTAAEALTPTLQTQAQSLSAEILRDLGDMQGALAACSRALMSASHVEVAPRLRAEVLRAQATLLLRVGRLQDAVNAHAEAIAVFRHAGARRHEARAKSSLAYAMYVSGRFEDAIALALEAIRIDLAIGGRFQIAKTLSNIAQSYRQLGDYERSTSYFQRALDAHERYEDQDSHADTLLSNSELLLERGETDEAIKLIDQAEALSDYVNSSYDAVHAKLLRAEVARRVGNSSMAVVYAFDARQVAETQAYASLNFYAMALEAKARIEIGELHTATLLATTTLGAVENLEGSEYSLETRLLCLEALTHAKTAQLGVLRTRTAAFVGGLAARLRSPGLRQSFLSRQVVRALLVSQRNEQATS